MSLLLHQPAPDFTLPDDQGKHRSLRDFLGQYVLLYFYPKDMTPGCTVEAQCFRDRFNELRSANVQVLGISVDSIESHQKFRDQYNLNFPLLSDAGKEVVKKYGVWVEKSMYGKKYIGIQRDSFLINPAGIVVKHYEKVNPANHPEEVLRDVLME